MSTKRKFQFTEAALRKLHNPSNSRAYYYDLELSALELRVTPTGAKSFYTYAWSSALQKPIRSYLGKWPALSVDEARRLTKKRVAEIADGKDPTVAKRAARAEATFGEALNAYFVSLRAAERKATTISVYSYLAERFLGDFRAKRLSSITPDNVLALRTASRDYDGSRAEKRTARPEKKNRVATANKLIRLVSQVFNHAASRGWNGKNPCSAIKPLPEAASPRYLGPAQIRPFIDACDAVAQRGDLNGDYFLTCILSGVRRRNVASARWDDVDFDRKVWTIPDTKNGLPLVVYLSGKLLEVFERRFQRRGFSRFVFPAESQSGHLEEPRKALTRIAKLAGLNSSAITVHGLKHTFISAAYDCGLNPVQVSRLGGHKITSITGRYGHVSEEQVREAYRRVAEHMLKAVEKTAAA